MKDQECVQFLQWALPRLQMHWPGFRKVRKQVCKRISRRMSQLGLSNMAGYQAYLETHASEWQVLDAFCRVTITRFYRDKAVFAFLEHQVLPTLARHIGERQETSLRVWCIGSCAGEEPYSVAILWKLCLQSQFPGLTMEIIASEVDEKMNRRARRACYHYSSVKNLPETWRKEVFVKQDDVYCLKPEYRNDVEFLGHDIRQNLPPGSGSFDLVLCRNLVFTYYNISQQCSILDRIRSVMRQGSALVIGIHEKLPVITDGFSTWSDKLRIFRYDQD